MKKLFSLFSALLVAGSMLATTASVTFSDNGYENGVAVESVTVDEVITLTFDKGSNNNAPKYYTTGTAIRLYGGNSMTVAAASGSKITSIALTFATGDGTNAITANSGSYADGAWTGEATAVVLTVGGTSGHRRVASVEVTYSAGQAGPIVVTGVTFENGMVRVGRTLNLASLVSVVPAAAANKNVSYEIVSGGEYISLEDGVVTGVAEGEAVVRVTTEEGNFTAEATITVGAALGIEGTYSSNVELADNADTKAYKQLMKVEGDETEYDILKMGTAKAPGSCDIAVPANTAKLHFHAIAWNGASDVNLYVVNASDTIYTTAINANTGLSGNPTYMLAGDPTEDYYCITFDAPLAEETVLTFQASEFRFALYGINYELDDNTQTGVESVEAVEKTMKVMIDGQMFILRDGNIYTVSGQMIR